MNDEGDQLRLSGGAARNLNLFSDHFLQERLPEWSEYADADVAALMASLRSVK